MFDPTVYENLKVVLEGAVYDLDLDGIIHITDRKDIVDLATMSRTYQIQFKRHGIKNVKSELKLFANLDAFTKELLHNKDNVGCEISIFLYVDVETVEECETILFKLKKIWDSRPTIQQTLSFIYPHNQHKFRNQIMISFDRKITEEQIDDLPELVDYTLKSIEALNR